MGRNEGEEVHSKVHFSFFIIRKWLTKRTKLGHNSLVEKAEKRTNEGLEHHHGKWLKCSLSRDTGNNHCGEGKWKTPKEGIELKFYGFENVFLAWKKKKKKKLLKYSQKDACICVHKNSVRFSMSHFLWFHVWKAYSFLFNGRTVQIFWDRRQCFIRRRRKKILEDVWKYTKERPILLPAFLCSLPVIYPFKVPW